jgi:diguanylate cyclase (GGDEF)-like protein
MGELCGCAYNRLDGLEMMNRSEIAVITDDPDLLALLRRKSASQSFVSENAGTGKTLFSIVDGRSGSAGSDKVRGPAIFLAEPGTELEAGAVLVARERFLEDPEPFLAMCERAFAAEAEVSRMQAEVETLSHVQELLGLNDTHTLSQRVTREALQILGLPFGTMLLHDPKVERYVTTFSDDPEHVEGGEFLPGVPPSMIQQAMAGDQGYAYEKPRGGFDGLLVLPIQIEHDLIGVIKVPVPSSAGSSFDESIVPHATRYVRAVTAILRNAYLLTRSRELALRDDLTRSFNRRFFEAYVEEEMERARRYKSVLSIIFLDLDDLKLVNNAHGHMAGSRTLQEVARRIMDAVRTVDKVVRFGGDEFCIILPQTDHEQATAVAARVREAIIRKPIQLGSDTEVRITASFGIASYPLHADTKDDLITAADAAMLLVKSTTKDEIGIARTSSPHMFGDRKTSR